jgi:hypothetical protein
VVTDGFYRPFFFAVYWSPGQQKNCSLLVSDQQEREENINVGQETLKRVQGDVLYKEQNVQVSDTTEVK